MEAIANLKFDRKSLYLFGSFGILFLVTLLTSIHFEQYALLLIPIAFAYLFVLITDYKKIYYLLFTSIPISVEFFISNTLATDLPAEPIIVSLMFVWFFLLLTQKNIISKKILTNNLIGFVFLHLAWMGITMIFATDILISFKFLLAKSWYVIVFVFLTILIIKTLDDFKILFWLMFIPSIFGIVHAMINHSASNFAFETINFCVVPFFRNHVDYASFLVLFLPFLWVADKWYKKGSLIRLFIDMNKILFIVAIYFSYTRAAWVAIIAMIAFYYVMKFRMLLPAILMSLSIVIIFGSYMLYENKYLDYAPDFRKTIYHDELGDHLSSTYKLEDLSTAERFYRWVSAVKMIQDRPMLGFGPGNFFTNYKKYTVSKFTTWVSGNPERSGVHNYFLKMAVDQGIIGLFIFILFTAAVLLKCQKVYHNGVDEEQRNWIKGIALSLVAIYVSLFFSDLIETHKVGSIFFLNIALLIGIDLSQQKKKIGT